MIDTNDEWIVQRTGMKERRIASEDEYSSNLAIKAVENLCTTYKKNLEDVDCIIVATTTADYVFLVLLAKYNNTSTYLIHWHLI